MTVRQRKDGMDNARLVRARRATQPVTNRVSNVFAIVEGNDFCGG